MRLTGRLMQQRMGDDVITEQAVAGLVGQRPPASPGMTIVAAWIEDGWVMVTLDQEGTACACPPGDPAVPAAWRRSMGEPVTGDYHPRPDGGWHLWTGVLWMVVSDEPGC